MTGQASVLDERRCDLGEGPLWHPTRRQLFWFDINRGQLLSCSEKGPLSWSFGCPVSAAGWLDEEHLLVASDTGLLRFSLTSGTCEMVVPLEAEDPRTRSNDGRADPWGGFWIGTMGRQAEPGLGAIWRYHRGELRRMFPGITISNAISFAPDGSHACFADTRRRMIWRVSLAEADGWPVGDPAPFIDLAPAGLNPDGAVIDAEGTLWVALWGDGSVTGFGPDGQRRARLALPSPHVSCPAFSGDGLDILLATTACEGLDPIALNAHPQAGMTFVVATGLRGQAEHQVVL
ncbi:SMP-30/gluconolactonase/LRE family protein [Paracoccus sanguinis]|uniref:SMP-30/gluconolactonase/LRE family protein n=1 Tax=Paracoccus sanguinis TaxID=1545044 RepID=UPI0009DEA5B6|nr:SMP-30/gluconolactonase/LRE family protein [Paracoccus sanguinis]